MLRPYNGFPKSLKQFVRTAGSSRSAVLDLRGLGAYGIQDTQGVDQRGAGV